MKKSICISALLLALVAGAAARADSLGADRARALVELQRILPLEEILRLNEAQLSGHVLSLELEGRAQNYYYKIKVLRPDGRYEKLRIDASTGAVLVAKPPDN